MAVSGTRRGPGWWMDRDGGWNPPELWPETTPPIPGWVRSENGRWQAPMEVVEGENGEPVIDLTTPKPASPAALRTPKHAAEPAKPAAAQQDAPEAEQSKTETPNLNLRFAPAEVVAEPAASIEAPTERRNWLIAGVIAVVSALLLVVFLVL